MADKSQKRRRDGGAAARPMKRRKGQPAYRSDSDSEPEQDFSAANLVELGDRNPSFTKLAAKASAGAASDSDPDSDPDSDSDNDSEKASGSKLKQKTKKPLPPAKDDDDEDDDSDSIGGWEDSDGDSDDDDEYIKTSEKKTSKRNDPSAFATSLSKILSTKLSTTKRSDPVLSRSADAHSSARAAADSVLEAKARKQLRDQKLRALEKGRVRDVMGGSAAAPGEGGSGMSVAEVQAEERRLRKVAQRGVVKLFNAVRAAQVKAGEAERRNRGEAFVASGRKVEKVNEMSKKGFLDLIASGGGKMKKGPLEEP